mmetsp:Transcript_64685/g.179377  ORF Transcript_64685/g.179377 Transcript_64685/m.179377 type:complete len:366 (-) Transcript_64685:225-1322(-)
MHPKPQAASQAPRSGCRAAPLPSVPALAMPAYSAAPRLASAAAAAAWPLQWPDPRPAPLPTRWRRAGALPAPPAWPAAPPPGGAPRGPPSPAAHGPSAHAAPPPAANTHAPPRAGPREPRAVARVAPPSVAIARVPARVGPPTLRAPVPTAPSPDPSARACLQVGPPAPRAPASAARRHCPAALRACAAPPANARTVPRRLQAAPATNSAWPWLAAASRSSSCCCNDKRLSSPSGETPPLRPAASPRQRNALARSGAPRPAGAPSDPWPLPPAAQQPRVQLPHVGALRVAPPAHGALPPSVCPRLWPPAAPPGLPAFGASAPRAALQTPLASETPRLATPPGPAGLPLSAHRCPWRPARAPGKAA